MGSGFANDVADMVSGSGTPTIYSAVVSSQFDADRLDYMRRDRLMTGSQHAGIDFEWLVENLQVGEVQHGVDETSLKPVQTFVLGRKAIFAAEAWTGSTPSGTGSSRSARHTTWLIWLPQAMFRFPACAVPM